MPVTWRIFRKRNESKLVNFDEASSTTSSSGCGSGSENSPKNGSDSRLSSAGASERHDSKDTANSNISKDCNRVKPSVSQSTNSSTSSLTDALSSTSDEHTQRVRQSTLIAENTNNQQSENEDDDRGEKINRPQDKKGDQQRTTNPVAGGRGINSTYKNMNSSNLISKNAGSSPTTKHKSSNSGKVGIQPSTDSTVITTSTRRIRKRDVCTLTKRAMNLNFIE
jgi:hypothetical protein